MSKLSFRARQLDAYKAMPVYRAEEIPEVTDVAAINRAVPQMPTGMEKEEETEHHLQRALSAQQVYGTSEALVIPVPETDDAKKQYEQIYPAEYKPPRQYIHAQSYGIDQEIPDYDIDSEDESWLESQSKKMEITPKVFEEMIDRLEKGSGQQVVELKDAKVLLKEDDDLIITVYDYWLNKRLNHMPHALIPTVKCEKRDGSTTNNPYVAFRRRTEKMQTRKNRKNDEVSYEKMLKLRRDLQRAVTVLEMIKKREKCKKELLNLTIEILDKRYEMEDFTGSNLAHAEAQKTSRSVFYPLYQEQASKESTDGVRKTKRKYEKKKHKSGSSMQYQPGDVDVMDYGSTEDEPLSPGISVSDQEEESHPDGNFAFRRKKSCSYHAPLDTFGNWPWHSQQSGGLADKRYRYSLTSIDNGPEVRRCIGYARRRRGRGGRIILDRAHPEQRADFWDRVISAPVPPGSASLSEEARKRLEPPNPATTTITYEGTDTTSPEAPTFLDYISESKWLHFTSTREDYDSPAALFSGQLDMSLDYLNDTSDPIIDLIPETPSPTTSGTLHNSGFTPTATVLTTCTTDKKPLTMVTSSSSGTAALTTLLSSDKTSNLLTIHNSAAANNKLLTLEDSIRQRQIAATKKDQQMTNNKSQSSINTSQSAKDTTSSLITNNTRTTTTKIVTSTHNSNSCVNRLVEPKKANIAVSALINGQSAGRPGNGIKHLNGPTKGDLKHAELDSTGSVTLSSIRKVSYPLTPSSDTSETTTTSMVSDLVQITSTMPGESGDNLTSRQIINSEKDFPDSAGLNKLAEAASTMEVS